MFLCQSLINYFTSYNNQEAFQIENASEYRKKINLNCIKYCVYKYLANVYNYISHSSQMRKRSPKQPQPEPVIQIEQPKPTRQEVLKKQLGNVEDKILSKLQNSELTINRQKVPYINEEQKNKNEAEAYEKIMREKRKMEERIKQLQRSQKIYQDRSRLIDKQKQRGHNQKVEITEEDKQKLKSLRKKMKQFEQNLQKKNREIEQQKLKNLKQQQEAELRVKQLNNQRKKLKIQANLDELKQKNLQREQRKKLEEQNLKKLQQKKKLFQILDNDWKEKNDLQERRKYQAMQSNIKQKKHLDFEDLRQHQKKYEQIISEKKRQLLEKRLSSSRKSHNTTFTLQKSKFYSIIMKEQEKVNQQQERKRQRAKQTQRKRLEYALMIREEHAATLKKSDEDEQNEQNQGEKAAETKIIRLTKEEIKQIGNTNLQMGNRRTKRKQNMESTLNTNEENMNTGAMSTISHYPDYLQQIRKKKIENNYYNGFYNSPKAEAEKIMRSKKLKNEDKIEKIKLLASRFDNSSADLVSKIQGKIQILQIIN